MAWTAINSSNRCTKLIKQDDDPNKPTNIVIQKPLSTASKYRINILAAAERLVANVPKKRTTASTKTQTAASAKAKKSKKVVAVAEQDLTPIKRTRKRKRSIDSEVSIDKSTCSMTTTSNAKVTPSKQSPLAQISSITDTVSLNDENESGRHCRNTSTVVHAFKSLVAEQRSADGWEYGKVTELSVNCSGEESQHRTATRHAGHDRLETTMQSSASPVSNAVANESIVLHNLKARSVIELSSDDSLSFENDFDDTIFDDNPFTLPTPQTTVSSASLQALPSTDDVANSPTPDRHPNVRVAQSPDRSQQEYDINVQLFATVNKINYANSMGQGQGVVFTDCFFPDKPPNITTISKIPYSARDLMSSRQKSATTKEIFKANVQIQARSPAGRVARRMQYEIVDITPTSWEELMEAKRMIEKDKMARQSATTTKEEIDRGIENKDTKAREEFSDPDLDEALPELFELFRSGGK
ncbi:hypothetical protein LTS08_003436 [Lithohypha guttulata]|nr:hypothetical protein LTS08_003436 [Lithohypha guttulata]